LRMKEVKKTSRKDDGLETEVKLLRAALGHAKRNLDTNRQIGLEAFALAEARKQELECLRAEVERLRVELEELARERD
jgi:hypothetical protein